MDYPRAFVSFPRIAGSGNEIDASARKNADVVSDWDLGVTSLLKVLQNAYSRFQYFQNGG
jgi:hypothetical protein